MITKYSHKEFYNNKCDKLLPLECEFCGKTFYKTKARIQSALRGNGNDTCCFCSRSCSSKAKAKKISITCAYCNRDFERIKSKINKRSKRMFCSKSCSVKFNFKYN